MHHIFIVSFAIQLQNCFSWSILGPKQNLQHSHSPFRIRYITNSSYIPNIIMMLGWKGILSRPTCLSMACNFKITFNKLLLVPKHYALHGYLIKQGLYLENTESIKFPLLLAPYSRKTPCSWSSVHLPNHHPIKDGWQLTPTTHQIL